MQELTFADLLHDSPDLDAAYDDFSREIPSSFLEEREFLRNRLRVRDQGPKSNRERILVQNGYTLHLIVAKEAENVVGAIYGHLISGIAPDNCSVGFVTYISVLQEYRRKGIGSRMVEVLGKHLEEDSLSMTGKQPVAMVYEIEAEGKEEIKGLVQKGLGAPLDITYYQPPLRNTSAAEPMHLWLQPLDLAIRRSTYSARFVISLVTNMLTKEYVGPDMKGFDPESEAYVAFLRSIGSRKEIGFVPI